MRKSITAVLSLVFMVFISGCKTEEKDPAIIGGADAPTTIIFESEEDQNGTEESLGDNITDEQALAAIKNYSYINNPDLKEVEEAGEYPVYWDVSGEENEAVVLLRSYTGAQIRYYINRKSGDTYVTEFVPGVTTEEERTGESFNVKDFISADGNPQTEQ